MDIGVKLDEVVKKLDGMPVTERDADLIVRLVFENEDDPQARKIEVCIEWCSDEWQARCMYTDETGEPYAMTVGLDSDVTFDGIAERVVDFARHVGAGEMVPVTAPFAEFHRLDIVVDGAPAAKATVIAALERL